MTLALSLELEKGRTNLQLSQHRLGIEMKVFEIVMEKKTKDESQSTEEG